MSLLNFTQETIIFEKRRYGFAVNMTTGTAKIQIQDAEGTYMDITDASWSVPTTGVIELPVGPTQPVLTGDATISLKAL